MPIVREDKKGLYVSTQAYRLRPTKPSVFPKGRNVYVPRYSDPNLTIITISGYTSSVGKWTNHVSEDWVVDPSHVVKKETKFIPHNDKLGRPVKLGDLVCYPHSNSLEIGTVQSTGKKQCRISNLEGNKDYRGREKPGKLVYPDDMILLEGADVTVYLLKKGHQDKTK